MYIGTIEYGFAILMTKLAILSLYHRVFVTPARKGGILHWGICVFAVILCLFYIPTSLIKIWECSPRERAWNKAVAGKCVSVAALFNSSGIFNTVTDLIMLLFPIWTAWRLQMSLKRKWALVMIFTLGLT